MAEELDVAITRGDQLYGDGLAPGTSTAIEKKLAKRHLKGWVPLVLYDITSSYYEGKSCPLARFGHDRDGKTGLPIIVYAP